MVSYYPLGEIEPGVASGVVITNVFDSVGTNPLTMVGSPVWTNHVSAEAAARTDSAWSAFFVGGQYGTNGILSTATDNFGIEAWVKATSTNGNECVAFNGVTSANGWGLYRAGGNFQALYGSVGLFGSVPVTLNQWTHLALVRNGGVGTFYVNGAAAGTLGITPNVATGRFAIGSAPQPLGTETWEGFLDNVRVFTFAPGQFTTNDLLWNKASAFAPVVATLPATSVSNANAVLNASVNPGGGGRAAAWFEWGSSSFNYSQQTTPISVGNGTGTLAVSDNLPGLTPGVVYHCRAVASNVVGVARGNDVVFGSPAITLNGGAVVTNECHYPFTDPGATASWPLLAIAAGGADSLALRSDRKVIAWGYNVYGQATVPAGLINVVAIAAGTSHNLALRSVGTVVAWGLNDNGQTNVPAGLTNVVAMAGGNGHSLALRSDGTVVAWGWNGYSQTNVPAGLTNVAAIAGGYAHSLALRSNGTVVAWGYNAYGQTNVPTGLTNVVAIAGETYHNLALRSDGTIIAWGDNAFGKTNVPAGLSNVVAIAGRGEHNLALRSDGTVVAWGKNDYGQTNVPAGLTNVVAISGGGIHSLALKSDGTIVGWGDNSVGQLNTPPGVNSLAVTASGSVDTNPPGSYGITYSVTNVLGGLATTTRTIIVADTLPPIVTLNGSNPILITNIANLIWVDPGATALDLCGGTLSVIASNNVNVNFPGAYAITYRATDASGNTGVATRTVAVTLPAAAPGDQNGDGLVSQSEIDAVYARYVTNSPWLYMTNVAGLGGTNVSFALSNSVLGAYTVEYTTNLTHWLPLGPATPRYLFTDTNAPGGPQRSYRLRYP